MDKNSFCIGFAYGERYGYEEVLEGKLTDREIGESYILAACLYEEIYGKQGEE